MQPILFWKSSPETNTLFCSEGPHLRGKRFILFWGSTSEAKTYLVLRVLTWGNTLFFLWGSTWEVKALFCSEGPHLRHFFICSDGPNLKHKLILFWGSPPESQKTFFFLIVLTWGKSLILFWGSSPERQNLKFVLGVSPEANTYFVLGVHLREKPYLFCSGGPQLGQ